MFTITRLIHRKVEDQDDSYPSGYVPMEINKVYKGFCFGLRFFKWVSTDIQEVSVKSQPDKKKRQVGFEVHSASLDPIGHDTQTEFYGPDCRLAKLK